MVIIVFKGLGGKIQPLTDEESPAGWKRALLIVVVGCNNWTTHGSSATLPWVHCDLCFIVSQPKLILWRPLLDDRRVESTGKRVRWMRCFASVFCIA
jgi:hypothetical protein